MGQSISVVQKPSTTPGVVRFETNRTLTGMGHERFRSVAEVTRDRPVDELARRLFATGTVDGLHVYGNVLTVDLAGGADGSGLAELIGSLFVHYVPGVVPPTDEELLGTPVGS